MTRKKEHSSSITMDSVFTYLQSWVNVDDEEDDSSNNDNNCQQSSGGITIPSCNVDVTMTTGGPSVPDLEVQQQQQQQHNALRKKPSQSFGDLLIAKSKEMADRIPFRSFSSDSRTKTKKTSSS